MTTMVLGMLDTVVTLLCVVLAILLLTKGPTRQLKIALLWFVAGFAVLQAVKSGIGSALLLVGAILVMNVGVMMAVTLLMRHPARKNLVPLVAPWPGYAVKQVEAHTRAFESVGFEPCGDRVSSWSFLGRERRSFIRFMRHGSVGQWAEIHALDEPKSVARMITSAKQGDVTVLTCDRQANEEFFRDALTYVQRVPAATSGPEMLRAHEAFSTRVAGTLEPVDDAIARHVAHYDRWVQRLLSSGQVVLRGDSFAVPLKLAFPSALRVMGAWFQ